MLPIRDSVPSRHRPVMTWTLIAANALVFLWVAALPDPAAQRVVYLLGLVPARLTSPQWALEVGLPPGGWLGFATSMFLHGGFLHLLGNMWTLWIFGDNVEDRMGPFRFLVFYLTCGLIAGLTHFLTNAASPIPTVGASGAIAGVMGAYFLLYPLARVVILVPLFFWPLFFEVPAILFLAFWFLLQLLSGAGSGLGGVQQGGIAWWAHVGGFVAGMLLVRLFLRHPPHRSGPEQFGFDFRAYR